MSTTDAAGYSLGPVSDGGMDPRDHPAPNLCPTIGCDGDPRYAAPGRGHRPGCDYIGAVRTDPVDEIESGGLAEKYMRIVVDLLAEFVDDEPCSFDHHGGCQTHGFLAIVPTEQCPMEQARKVVNFIRNAEFTPVGADCKAAETDGLAERLADTEEAHGTLILDMADLRDAITAQADEWWEADYETPITLGEAAETLRSLLAQPAPSEGIELPHHLAGCNRLQGCDPECQSRHTVDDLDGEFR